jgi:hypothetical protein
MPDLRSFVRTPGRTRARPGIRVDDEESSGSDGLPTACRCRWRDGASARPRWQLVVPVAIGSGRSGRAMIAVKTPAEMASSRRHDNRRSDERFVENSPPTRELLPISSRGLRGGGPSRPFEPACGPRLPIVGTGGQIGAVRRDPSWRCAREGAREADRSPEPVVGRRFGLDQFQSAHLKCPVYKVIRSGIDRAYQITISEYM